MRAVVMEYLSRPARHGSPVVVEKSLTGSQPASHRFPPLQLCASTPLSLPRNLELTNQHRLCGSWNKVCNGLVQALAPVGIPDRLTVDS